MKNSIRKAIYSVITFFIDSKKLMFLLADKEERQLLGFKTGGYLYEIGWVNSIVTSNIIDRNNDPIPWVTYPFIQFIEPRLNKAFRIFEFGSGNSTLYYAGKVAEMRSVENDLSWYEKIKNSMPQNVTLFYCELIYGGEYSSYAITTNEHFDMIIVDGRDRVNCCKNNISALRENGVIVLDDSERAHYMEAADFLATNGFKKIDFWGIAPGIDYLKCTSVFYRDNNCLGI